MKEPTTNEERSALEVEQFKTNPPDRYFAYITNDFRRITTWMGDELGAVIERGNRFHSNMGDERINIRVKGINGLTYAGTAYVSAGDYVRLRQIKS